MVQATVVLDGAHRMQVYRLLQKKGSRVVSVMLGIVTLGLAVFTAIAATASQSHGAPHRPIWPWILMMGLMALWIGSMPWLTDLSVRRRFQRDTAVPAVLSWTISEEGMAFDSDQVKGLVRWGALSKVVVRPDRLLTYDGKRPWHWIPRTAFSRPGDFDEAIRLIPPEKFAQK